VTNVENVKYEKKEGKKDKELLEGNEKEEIVRKKETKRWTPVSTPFIFLPKKRRKLRYP